MTNEIYFGWSEPSLAAARFVLDHKRGLWVQCITNTSLSWGECCSSLSEYVALCLWFLVCFVDSTWMESNPVILGMEFHYAWSRVRSINGRFGKMMIFLALLSVRLQRKGLLDPLWQRRIVYEYQTCQDPITGDLLLVTVTIRRKPLQTGQ